VHLHDGLPPDASTTRGLARDPANIVISPITKALSPLAVLAIGVALAMGVLVISLRLFMDERDVSVYSLRTAVPAGHLVTEGEVVTIDRDRDSSSGMITSKGAMVGHVTTRRIGEGHVLRPGDVSALPLPAGAGRRAFAVAVTSDVTLSEPFRTGDQVDLTFTATNEHQSVVVANVLVVEVRARPSTLVLALDAPQTDATLGVLGRARLVVTRAL